MPICGHGQVVALSYEVARLMRATSSPEIRLSIWKAVNEKTWEVRLNELPSQIKRVARKIGLR